MQKIYFIRFFKSCHFGSPFVSREMLELTHIFRHSWYHLFLNKGMSRSTFEGGFFDGVIPPNKESLSLLDAKMFIY
jgi:hypothetical protein